MRSATRKKTGINEAYKAWIRSLPCICCWGPADYAMVLEAGMRFNAGQVICTEAAHVGERGISQKCPDEETIPLCGFEHHREGKFSAHKLGKGFWAHWGLDKEKLLAELRQQFEKENNR